MEELSYWPDIVTLFLFTVLALLMGSLWFYRRLIRERIAEKKNQAEVDEDQQGCVKRFQTLHEILGTFQQRESGTSRPLSIHGKALRECTLQAWLRAKPHLLKEYLAHVVSDRREILEQVLLEVAEELIGVMSSRKGEQVSSDYSERLSSCAFFVMQQVLLGINNDDRPEDLNAMYENLKILIRRWPQYNYQSPSLTSPRCSEQRDTVFEEARQKFLHSLKDVISKHKKEGKVNIATSKGTSSYVDYYLRQKDASESTDEELLDDATQHLLVIFVCGTEALHHSFLSSLSQTADKLEMQERIFREISDTIGQKSSVYYLLESRAGLPFTEATTREIFRTDSPVPFVAFSGNSGKEEETVVVELKSVLSDRVHWKNPDTFDPTRFLDPLGEKLLPKEAFIPFSSGVSSCPGQVLAELSTLVMLALVLQKFQVEKSGVNKDDDESLSLRLTERAPLAANP